MRNENCKDCKLDNVVPRTKRACSATSPSSRVINLGSLRVVGTPSSPSQGKAKKQMTKKARLKQRK